MIKNIGQLMKQAQQMQDKMAEMQDKMAEVEVTGSSGGGMVEVTLNGKSEMMKIKIDPALIKSDEADVLEDLIVAATNDAKSKVESTVSEEMKELTGGMGLPAGFKLPF